MNIEAWDFTGVEIFPGAAMDYPQAWEFVNTTKIEDHNPICSYAQTDGGILCDCHIIMNENDRRANERAKSKV